MSGLGPELYETAPRPHKQPQHSSGPHIDVPGRFGEGRTVRIQHDLLVDTSRRHGKTSEILVPKNMDICIRNTSSLGCPKTTHLAHGRKKNFDVLEHIVKILYHEYHACYSEFGYKRDCHGEDSKGEDLPRLGALVQAWSDVTRLIASIGGSTIFE